MNVRIFLHVLSMEVRKQLSYRVNFWATALLGFVFQLGAAYFVWEAMFRESGRERIGGYTFREMVTYYVLVLLLGKLVRGLEFGAGGLSEEIYQGTLTRYLIYPTKVFPFKYAQQLGQMVPSAAQLLLFGGLCAVLLPVGESLNLGPATLAMTAAAVLLGHLLHFLIHWPLESVAFWQDHVWSLNVMSRFVLALLGGAMLPPEVFPGWAREALAYLPFQYLFAFPANVLMGRVSAMEWAVGMTVCAAWCGVVGMVSAAVWRRGLRQYAGVGL